MKITYHPNFQKALKKFSVPVQNKFEKQVFYLITNLRHPSLHAKKYNEEEGVWQARVDKSVRFFFEINGDTYTLLNIQNHPK